MSEATKTRIELLCRSLYFGQVTLCRNSSYESIKYFFILFIDHTNSARVERLELPANGFGDHYSTN